MKMTWSCVVEGEPDELATLLSKVPAAVAAFTPARAPEPLAAFQEPETVLQDEAPLDEAVAEEPAATLTGVEESSAEAPIPEVAEVAEVAEPAAKPKRATFQKPIKDQVVSFLESRKHASLADIAKATGIPSSKLSPRVAELKNAGVIGRTTNLKSHNRYTLLSRDKRRGQQPDIAEGEGKVVSVDVLRRPTSEREDFSMILNALVDTPAQTIRDLRETTGIPIDILEDRIQVLQQRALVAVMNPDSGTESCFIPLAPTRKTQLSRESDNRLRDVVLELIRQHPGETSLQLSIRLGCSYSEVARRLSDLRKSGEARGEGGDSKATWRWYRSERELIPA